MEILRIFIGVARIGRLVFQLCREIQVLNGQRSGNRRKLSAYSGK
jgi:hypothetical protein